MRVLHSGFALSLLILTFLFCGCVTTRDGAGKSGAILETTDYIVVPVYYGTDRNYTGDKASPKYYGHKYDDAVSMGICMVSIPKERKTGEADSPSIWESEDPARHVILQKAVPMGKEKLISNLRRQEKSELLIFIHGFSTIFEDAARRTAQIAYDLNFKGQAVMYSWPSKGDISGYVHDKDIINTSSGHLREFLNIMASESGADAIHIIAHSMGNMALIKALVDIARQSPKPVFAEIMLVAPDVNVDEFKGATREFRKIAKRVTLYASSKDKALMISKQISGGLHRAGEADDGIIVLPEMDTVDVSNIDTSLIGHSYFGDNNSVISDMVQLLKGLSPFNRSLVPRTLRDMKYWIFQPPVR